MKNSLKLLLGCLIIATILLSACAPPPPPVTQDQLEMAENEAIAEEEKAGSICTECDNLEAEVAAKQAQVDDLNSYQKELEANK
jgi:outer membrane murein-binding lipoprotein Lpp